MAAQETSAETRRFKVFRFKRGGHDGEHFDEFVVPVGPHTTVLDALLWIQLHRDRTLALRHSCLHASCGTCGVLVNRREALACVTSVSELGDEVTVEPLANIPVLTDLVVDMDEFYARFQDDHPLVRASEFLPEAETPVGPGGVPPVRGLPRVRPVPVGMSDRLDLPRVRRPGRAHRRPTPAR
jgi:succinate dehydrogenase/fumarate reductase-like Fe-S protein